MARMRTLLAAGLASALGVCGADGQAAAQTIDAQKAQAWLEQTFGITSERVVEAKPDALVVLRTIEPRPPSNFRVIVHFENFGPPDPLTPPSSDQEYLINCPSRRFHVERIESFSENGARGAQSTSFGPDLWGRAVPNSPEARVVSAVCGPVAPPQAEAKAEPPPSALPAVRNEAPPPAPAARPAPAPAPRPRSVRVQLFAGDDRATAQRFVEALPARLPAVAEVGSPEIVVASSGGRPIYRVQVAGFASAAEAARFCSAARAAGQDCFVPSDTQR
jgi:hypothetical protein